MHKQLKRAILATGTVTATLCLAVPAAMAAGTWTVSGGPSFTSMQSNGSTFTLTDTVTGSHFICTLATAAGVVHNEKQGDNTAIGSVTSATFGDATHLCVGPLTLTGTASLAPGATPTLNAGSYDSNTFVMTGTITGFDEILTAGGCTIEVKGMGTAGVTYSDLTSLLQFTTSGDNLSVKSNNCKGFGFNPTDAVTFSSTGGETVTGNPNNPITVSQP